MPRARADWEGLENQGLCPECRERSHVKGCRKAAFDHAYAIGYHDGANDLQRHDHAFAVEMIERGEYEA